MHRIVDLSHNTAQVPFLLEVYRAEGVGEVVIRVARIECRNQVRKGSSRRDLAQRSKRTRARQVNFWDADRAMTFADSTLPVFLTAFAIITAS